MTTGLIPQLLPGGDTVALSMLSASREVNSWSEEVGKPRAACYHPISNWFHEEV